MVETKMLVLRMARKRTDGLPTNETSKDSERVKAKEAREWQW